MSGECNELLATLDLLCAPKKLNREKGESRLRETVLNDHDLKYLKNWIADKLEGLSNWEDVYGGLTAAQIILESAAENVLNELGLINELETHILECHENAEFRVRIAAGQVLGLLCRRCGVSTFVRYIKSVLDGIRSNLERELGNATEAEASMQELHLAKERDEIGGSRSTLSIFHNTAGWKNLETWMKCLQEMVVNLPPEEFVKVDRLEIRNLIFQAVVHTNRFVRETGFDVLKTLIAGYGCHSDPGSSDTNYTNIATRISVGLSDNWSQVRMAASRACRVFFEVAPPPGCTTADAFPILLPPMCLNRYYVAEGVRVYSQETWCLVTKGAGRQLIGQYLPTVLQYYFQEADADNHAVREAACTAIAEVAAKLDAELLRPHLPSIIDTLVTCFGDESWPVRDAACTAVGTLVSTFPGDTAAAGHPDLMAEQLLLNLSDGIPSVRDGAAYAIARILEAAKNEALTKLYATHIETALANVQQQPKDSHGAESAGGEGRGPGVSHVIVRRGADAHDDKHTNQLMFSCCSLGPKLQKGKKGGGCADGVHHRRSEPWECADGAVRLIGQLAECAQDCFSDRMVDQMVKAASLRHYTHYAYLLETVCATIGLMCQHLDRVRFKRHLDELLVLLSAAMTSYLPLAVVAAEETLDVLVKRIGVNVLRGRVEGHFDLTVSRALLSRLPETT